MDESSRIFCGHRALGYVANNVPLVSRYIRKRRENLVATAVGKSFHTYGGAKLGLLSVSGIHPENIRTLAADSYMVYSAAGNQIYAWRRGSELKHVYKGHEHAVKLLLPFGPHLISVDEKSNLKVFDIKAEKEILHLEFVNFDITTICHPPTYKDKILLGSSQGPLQLWNLKSTKKIYKFKGWEAKITCLEPCPTVLDAVAIGLETGDIIVHNLKMDETFVQFKQDWGPVTCLAFRSDRNDLLISGSSEVFDEDTGITSGHIAIWNLNERKMAGQMRDAHTSSITGMVTFPGEPILMTSSPDNTIKQWIFDMPDGGGRLLKLREGHSEPPNKIRFYGSLGSNILSAAQDSTLRSFSTVTDLLNKNFGVASYNRKLSKKHKKLENPAKMKPIVDFTSETTKEQEWDNIACIHQETQVTTTWSFKKQKMGELKLRHPRFKEDKKLRESQATCLNLSVCGNFVFIGYDSGFVDKFNIQSGLHRGTLETNKKQHQAHPGCKIQSIVSDGLNQLVITADNEKLIKFWKFDTNAYLDQMTTPAKIQSMTLHRGNGLMVIVMENRSMEIVDIITKNIIRRFFDIHKEQVTDIAFSADSRWLVTASIDKSVKIWDVPSGTLIDHLGFDSHVTSLAMSPTSDFLATTHDNDLGIYLWSNKSLYGHVALKPLDQTESQPIHIQMPSVKHSQEDILSNAIQDLEVDQSEEEMEESWNKDQLDPNLVTLAGLAPAKWQNLYNLDVIKARNKPKEVISKPTNAPFFLPTITGPDGQTRFNLEETQNENEDQVKTAKVYEENFTQFGQKLFDSKDDLGSCGLIGVLKEMGPSAIDMEIIALCPEGGGSVELMTIFLQLIQTSLEKHQDFEAVQAYLGLFLKHHSEMIMNNEKLIEALEELKPSMNQAWTDLKQTLTNSATLVAFAKNALLSSG